MYRHVIVLFALVATLGAGCTDEDTTPVDLFPTTVQAVPASSAPHGDLVDPSNDPNAQARAQAQAYAAQQCIDDPNLETGVINIVDPDTDQVVGSIQVDCAEARLGNSDSQ